MVFRHQKKLFPIKTTMEWYTFFQSLIQRSPKSIRVSVLLERFKSGSPGVFFPLSAWMEIQQNCVSFALGNLFSQLEIFSVKKG